VFAPYSGYDDGRAALHHSAHDVLVAGATTVVALQLFPYLAFSGFGLVCVKVHGAHHHSSSTEAALKTIELLNGGLHWVHRAVSRDKAAIVVNCMPDTCEASTLQDFTA
jgi:hypothetical protein